MKQKESRENISEYILNAAMSTGGFIKTKIKRLTAVFARDV